MIGEPLKMAVQSLWSHKLRSTMTILGVVIGVASVLTVTSLGAAFEASITSQFDGIDEKSVFVTCSAAGPQQGPPTCGQFGLIFTEVDRQELLALPGIERVLAAGQVTVSGIETNGTELPFRFLTGTTADAEEIRKSSDYAMGGPFVDGEPGVVLGWGIAEQLGGNIEVGDTLRITYEDGSHSEAPITGILALQDSFFGGNNGQVFVPLDPFYGVTRDSPSTGDSVRVYGGFTVVADNAREVDSARDLVRAYMDRSDANKLLAEDLQILVATPSDIQADISTAFDQVTIFIAAIAGVSLLVGAIMIGTIMLISVTERTKEIGMMKAIGATDGHVLRMFLLESGIIGLLGSVIGIGLGLAGGAILVQTLFADGDEAVAFVVPWEWVGFSVLVGVLVGVVAGVLPARRAVRIEPVEALSYE